MPEDMPLLWDTARVCSMTDAKFGCGIDVSDACTV
jgi:hypothetical protein